MRFVIALAAALAAGTAANAVPVTSFVAGVPSAAQDPGPLAGQTVLIDWEGTPPAGAVTGNFQLVTGSGSGFAAPAGNTTQYLSVPRSLQETPLSATVDLTAFGISPWLRSFSLYWGSIDTYNTITFLDSGMNQVFTLGGAGVPLANPNGDQGNQASNKRVNFDFGAGANVRYVVVTSSQFAFESDDWAFGVVPEPATWAMLILGFGLIGASLRRRQGVMATTA
ncbi:MAG: PEPxxWA-CTERM sorting domain-containing protein [Thermaurantiacus sp.]